MVQKKNVSRGHLIASGPSAACEKTVLMAVLMLSEKRWAGFAEIRSPQDHGAPLILQVIRQRRGSHIRQPHRCSMAGKREKINRWKFVVRAT